MIDADWVRRFLAKQPVRWIGEEDGLVHEGTSDYVYQELTPEELDEWAAEFRDGSRSVYATPLWIHYGRLGDGVGEATEDLVDCLVCLL